MSLPGDNLSHKSQIQARGALLCGTPVAQQRSNHSIYIWSGQVFVAASDFIKEDVARGLSTSAEQLLHYRADT